MAGSDRRIGHARQPLRGRRHARTISAAQVGSIETYEGYGPLVLQVEEGSIERRVEALFRASPILSRRPSSQPSPAGVTFRYVYEGLASPAHPADPQLTIA